MEAAIEVQRNTGKTEPHRAWIGELLGGYYDPMYDYQIKQNEKQITFTGDKQAVAAWLGEQGIQYLEG